MIGAWSRPLAGVAGDGGAGERRRLVVVVIGRLAERDRQIALAIAQGKPNAAIAQGKPNAAIAQRAERRHRRRAAPQRLGS